MFLNTVFGYVIQGWHAKVNNQCVEIRLLLNMEENFVQNLQSQRRQRGTQEKIKTFVYLRDHLW